MEGAELEARATPMTEQKEHPMAAFWRRYEYLWPEPGAPGGPAQQQDTEMQESSRMPAPMPLPVASTATPAAAPGQTPGQAGGRRQSFLSSLWKKTPAIPDPASPEKDLDDVARDWFKMMASPTYSKLLSRRPDLVTPKFGLVEASKLISFNTLSNSWSHTQYNLPSNTLILNSWSAGPNLIMELCNRRTNRSAFYLCNPLRSTFSKLPPCLTITTITTFGYDWNTIIAIGTAPTGLVAIEILTFERIAPKWLQFGTLPYAYSVHPRAEVVDGKGAVYLLCAQPTGTMLEIKNSPPYITHYVNVPGFYPNSQPKLVSCSNNVFLVETGIITGNTMRMWRFQPENASEPWHSILLQAPPFLQPVARNSLRVLAVRGMGVSLYFVFPSVQIAILVMTQNEWFSLPKVDVAKSSTYSIVVWEEPCS